MLEEEYEKQIEEMIPCYEDLKDDYQQDRLVGLLREIQEVYGYLPDDVQQRVCQEFGIKEVVIKSLLKYYPSLHAVKRHIITLCVGPRCSARGCGKVADAVREELRVIRENKAGLVFAVRTQNCMKQCTKGPNLKIDDKLYSGVKPEDVGKILGEYLR